MRVLHEFTTDKRMYPGVQDPPMARIPIPFTSKQIELYRYYIVEVNGTNYLADETLLDQLYDGEDELVGTIPLGEDEVIILEEAEYE